MAKKPKIFIVVQGLFEKSDSIGFDAFYQYELIKCQNHVCYLVAEKYDDNLYQGAEIRSSSWFFDTDVNDEDFVIYHYCDGWDELENHLEKLSCNIICRWHNNTPPWFYAEKDVRSTKRTIGGFQRIKNFIKADKCFFAVNSIFTLTQLQSLGSRRSGYVVYPATRYLDIIEYDIPKNKTASDTLRILFVSRVVAHKGHKHVLSLANYIERAYGRRVEVHFAGRRNPSASDYDQFLQNLSDELGVTTIIHGEISESSLKGLYNSCDVFCCLSEHEGFGLPMFEAYTCGLPSVSWGICAVGELTHHNPLSPRQLDIPYLAAATMAACEPSNRQLILDMQKRLLAAYDRQIVDAQILSMLSEPPPKTMSHSVNPLEGLDLSPLQASIQNYLDAAPDIEPHVEDHETPGNLVTPYDIAAYERLLFGAQGNESLVVGPPQASTSLEIKPNQFFTTHGVKTSDSIVLSSRRDGYDVFGPYISVPPGHYRVDFHINLQRVEANGGVRLLADVASEMRGTIAESLFELSSRNSAPPSLSFLITDRADVVEFRLKTIVANNGPASFTGTTLRRLADPTDLIKTRRPSLNQSARWHEKVWKRYFNRTKPSDVDKLFYRADQLRNQGALADAATAYETALTHRPDAYDYLIQAGHAFKETGELSKSADYYEAALKLRDNDPDLLLNMGHLYKVMGDANRAQQCYAYAVSLYPAVLYALNELNASGVTTSQASELAAALTPN